MRKKIRFMIVLVSAQALVRTLRPPSMKRSAYDAIGPEELRAMLHEAKRTVSTLEHRLLDLERCRPACDFNALQKLAPIGARDNGEFIYASIDCGRTQ